MALDKLEQLQITNKLEDQWKKKIKSCFCFFLDIWCKKYTWLSVEVV